MTIVERLMARCNVNQETGCWLWTGAKLSCGGYGQITTCEDGKEQNHRTHRLSYELFIGPIPEGMYVCHTCDVPLCINPAHLFVGTQQDNMADMVSKGRSAKGVIHGCAKLTPEAVRQIRTRYANGGVTMRELGNEFGVTRPCIRFIVRRERWAHVQ